jgi:hypothetical protein
LYEEGSLSFGPMPFAAARIRGWVLGVLAGITVFAFAAGSGSISSVKHVGHTARWAALFALCVAALIEAVPRVRRDGLPPGLRVFIWLPLSFLALCLLSTTWSPDPRLTFARTASLGILFLAAAALAVVTATDAVAMRRLLTGLALGAAVVGAVGFVMLALGVDAAAQTATAETPWRFRGFGENPNTVAVLAAVALPLVAWLGLTARTQRSRVLWSIAFATLLGSTVAAGSRGGQAAALFGIEAVLLTTILRRPQRFSAAVACALLIVGGIALREASQPAAPAFYSAIPKPPATVKMNPAGLPMRPLPPRADEIGHPLLSHQGTTAIGSGRVAVWIGTLKDVVVRRPLLGYGFGTEERVFVDRWYGFQGGTPENSIIGVLLQVGLVGLLLVLALAAVVVVRAVRALRSSEIPERSAARVGIAVILAGTVLAFFQTYLYSVGNVATVTLWVVVFLTAAAIRGARTTERGGRS